MKKLIYSLMALAMVAVSCQKDAGSLDYEGKDTVAVTIGVGVQELDATRSGETDMNSGLGAIDNFTADEWEKYDVRYIMEIYDVTDGFVNLDEPIKKREVQTYDEYQETMFSVRLIPNRKYRFVFWADFVNQGSEDDLHYNTTDLKAVTRLATAVAMDECQDAYFVQKDLEVGSNGIEESVVLKRPFGKIRVITTDYDDVNIGSEPDKVVVKFYNHQLLTTLNAVTGVAEGKTVNEYTYTVAKDAPYTKGYDELDENMTLFSDYILAADETVGAQEVNFTIEVWGKDDRVINSHDFNTQIPLERNHLTTIVGNLLTLQNDITISIDDNFDGEYIRNWDEEAATIENGNWGYGELNANGNYEFDITAGTNSFTLILPKDAVNQTSGKINPVGKAELVASEDDLVKNTFAISNLMVDPTRAAQPATPKSGTLHISNWNDGVHAQFDLYYSFDPEAEPAEYKNIRFEFKGDALAMTTLATPVVATSAVENVITLSWAAVEGAGSYAITNGTEMPVFVNECEYTFTGEFATEYTFSVVAVPADEAKNYPSEAAEVTIAIGAELLATPVVTAEAKDNTIKLTWEAITGANKYGITVGTEMPVFVEVCEYTFTGDYNTEYTFNVVALADDEARYKPSTPATVTAKTEMPGVVAEFNKMDSKGYNSSAYFFTFDLTNDKGDTATLYISDFFATEAGVKNASEWTTAGYPNPLEYKNYPSYAGTQNGFHIDNINIGGVNYGKPTTAEGTGLTCEDGVITITAVLGDVVATMTIDQNNLVKPKQPRTVTVKVNAAMPEMYFYSWTDAGEIAGSWPGTLMTNNGDGEFSYTYSEEWDGQTVNFIFNNGKSGVGSNQTEDIKGVVLDDDKFYERYDIVVPQEDTYGLVGTFNDDPLDRWGADVLMEKGDDGWYRIENFEFATDGAFLVRKNGQWEVSNGGGKYGGVSIDKDGDYQLTLGGQDIAITAGTYNFAFNPATAILNVEKVEQSAGGDEPEGPVTFDPWTFKAGNLSGNPFTGYSVTLTGDNGHVIVLTGVKFNVWGASSATLNNNAVEFTGNGAMIDTNNGGYVKVDITIGNTTYKGTSTNAVA